MNLCSPACRNIINEKAFRFVIASILDLFYNKLDLKAFHCDFYGGHNVRMYSLSLILRFIRIPGIIKRSLFLCAKKIKKILYTEAFRTLFQSSKLNSDPELTRLWSIYFKSRDNELVNKIAKTKQGRVLIYWICYAFTKIAKWITDN